jgi:RNA polymerase sigma-70 factor (ECF subfamily)
MEAELGLVTRARDGDRAAFEELVRRFSRMVYGRLYLELGDVHRAEDLVQETFMRAFRAIRDLANPAGFRTWLGSVAQSALLDHFRRRGAQRRAEPPRAPAEVLDGVAAPDADADGDAREKVRGILNSLPEEYRLPLTLRYLDGADYETIQSQLGLAPGALRGILYRGLQLLRKAVKSSEVFHESH